MVSVLFMGLSAHLRGGLEVWHRTQAGSETLQRRRVAWDRLERDLASAFLYDPRPESYGAEEGALPWPEFASSALAFFTVAPATRTQPAAVRIVRYACEEQARPGTPERAGDGIRGLWRVSRSVSEARLGLEGKHELVLQGCEGLELRYGAAPSEDGGPLDWQAEWANAHAQLPRLVEVTIRVSGETLRRVLAVPSGVLGTSGS